MPVGGCMPSRVEYVCVYVCTAWHVWCGVCVCMWRVCTGGMCGCVHAEAEVHTLSSLLTHLRLSQRSKCQLPEGGHSQPYPVSLQGPCPEGGTLKFPTGAGASAAGWVAHRGLGLSEATPFLQADRPLFPASYSTFICRSALNKIPFKWSKPDDKPNLQITVSTRLPHWGGEKQNSLCLQKTSE